MVEHPLTGPIIISKGRLFSCHELRKEGNKNVLDMHSTKKREIYVSKRTVFSLRVCIRFIHSNSIQLIV